MNFSSTRGGLGGVTSAQAIRMGIAPDGGLFTPESIPQLTAADLKQLSDLSYQELAVRIISLFLTDYPQADLVKMVEAAYAVPEKFDDPKVTPVVKLADGEYVLELWHGPTCAFKDVALQLLPYLMTKASELTNDPNEIVILVATSGDTGKAALEGFKDVPGTKIIVFFPDQGVSEMQRLQMVTQEGQNTFVVAVKGNFDDAQTGVKQIFTDLVVAAKLNQQQMSFSSANSINWGRLVPQIVYYFYGYFDLCRQGVIHMGERLNVTVPTGNFGNILAAYLAKQMGLPLGKLICASNSNNVLTDFINTGGYNRNRYFYTTVSPSMDILISSNLERLLYYLAGDTNLVQDWMQQLQATGEYQVGEAILAKLKADIYGGYADEALTQATIREAYQTNQMVLDTHTAVGAAVYQRYQQETGDTTPMLLASTASPFKFNASVIGAIAGEDAVAGYSEFELLAKMETLSGMKIPEGLNNLHQKPVLHQQVCQKDQLSQVVTDILGL